LYRDEPQRPCKLVITLKPFKLPDYVRTLSDLLFKLFTRACPY